LATKPDEVLTVALHHLEALAATALLVTPQTLGNLPATAVAAAERCLRRNQPQPAAAAGWPGEDYGFLPLTEGLALGHGRLSGREAPRRAQAIAALADQTRAALQRLDFADKAHAERLRAEAFATRSAVLTSLSHDLRTPLATILGAASALKELDASLPPEARSDLLTAIEEEAERLNRHVANLLQLSRLELGAAPRRDWVDLNDIAEAAATRARRAFAGAQIDLDLGTLPMIRTEGGLVEQALFNLIDNGLTHGASPVRISSGQNGALWLRVGDGGPGLPPALRAWLASPDMRPAPGQRGLGLAVAKGIAKHLGGSLTAEDGSLTLRLPEAI
jgi:two-component system sensor histidine kinase KdpD